MSNGLTDHQMYQYIMRALDPRTAPYKLLRNLFGDPAKDDRVTIDTRLADEVSFSKLRKPRYLYCLQQYRPGSSISIMDILETIGPNCPQPGRETEVLNALYKTLQPIIFRQYGKTPKWYCVMALLENTFMVYAKMMAFYFQDVDASKLTPAFSINDEVMPFGLFMDHVIEEYRKDSSILEPPFVMECGNNDDKSLDYRYLKEQPPTRTHFPLSEMLKIAGNPFMVTPDVYPTMLVWPNFLANDHVLFNLNTVRYHDENSGLDTSLTPQEKQACDQFDADAQGFSIKKDGTLKKKPGRKKKPTKPENL